MHALAGQRVQIRGQRRDQRLAFAGAHLGDLALVQHHAADQLHVEMTQAERAARGLAHGRERLGQQVVERLAGSELLAELAVLAASRSSDSACSAGSNALMRLTMPLY